MGIATPSYQMTCDEPGCDRTGPTASTVGEARTRASFTQFKVEKYPSTVAWCAEHRPKEDA